MVLAQMAETIGWGTPSDLVKILEKDSEILNSLLEEFALLARDAQIRLFCFFEQEKSDLVGLFVKGISWKSQELIVDEASATITSVEKLGLKSDHFHLNKYDGPKDGNFKFVSEEIRITAQKADGIIKTRQNQRRQALVNDRTYHAMIDYLGKGFQDIDAAKNGAYKGPRGTKLSSILELDNFKSWREQSSANLLWVHGKAGTGQGAIASSAIESLEQSRGHASIVTSFFCDQGDKQRRSFKGLLQMVVRQIIDLDQDLARHLLSDSTNSKDAGKQDFDPDETLRVPALWDALHNMAKDLPGGYVFVIVYGLEQLSKESLDAFLQYIMEGPQVNRSTESEAAPVKWLLLSRSGRPNIEKTFRSKVLEINLEDAENSAQVSDDLRTHISVSVDELSLPASLAYFVKRHILSRAEDNWIYVSLVIQELKNAWLSGRAQHADIRKLLESFPYGLTDMFEHVRKRVLDPHAEGFEYTKEILRCRICAYVAPTLRELAVMAGLPIEVQTDMDALKAYIVRCGAFLVLRGDRWNHDNNTVEWIDISAQEHLEKYAKDDLALDLNDMQHGIIALRSLEYIYHDIEQREIHRDKHAKREKRKADAGVVNRAAKVEGLEADIIKSIHPNEYIGHHDDWDAANIGHDANTSFDNSVKDDVNILSMGDLRYPIRYWVEHAKRAPRDVLDEFNFRHPFWQDGTNARQEWWRIIEDVHARPEQTNVSVLHVAVILKFPDLVDYLLDKGWKSDIHKKDSLGFQPLYYACEGGQEEIVNSLLGAKADINYRSDRVKPTALYRSMQWPSRYCHHSPQSWC